MLSRRYANTGLLSSATCTPPRTTPTPPPPIPRAPAAPCNTTPPFPAPVPCPARPALLLSSAPSPPSSATRQCPPVLVLRCCPRPPRRHLASRNTKGTGARPQPRTTPPPRPAPAPCPARPALPPSFAPSPPHPAPLRPRTPRRHLQQGKRPTLRRCGLARPIINLQQGKARSTERQPGGECARKQV